MSGHNRWTKIKRKKEAMGATKGKLFTKLIKEITVAARMGGADPDGNARLRSALTAARDANMPADNIQRAVKKGTGELEGVAYEEIVYEGYAPGGVPIIVECLTDNRNRTAGEIRSLFIKGGGNLGEQNSVTFMFDRKGNIEVKGGIDEDKLMEVALDAGAEDVIDNGDGSFDVRTTPNDLFGVADKLEKAGVQLGERKVAYFAKQPMPLDTTGAQKVARLLELLEDCDDVQNLYVGADDEALAAAAA